MCTRWLGRYDHVFDCDASNESLYQELGEPLLVKALGVTVRQLCQCFEQYFVLAIPRLLRSHLLINSTPKHAARDNNTILDLPHCPPN